MKEFLGRAETLKVHLREREKKRAEGEKQVKNKQKQAENVYPCKSGVRSL